MAVGSTRRSSQPNYWPGFVDALAALLVVVVFMVMVFALAQFFLSDALSGREAALERLNRQVDELARMLDLERDANADLRLSVSQLSSQLQGSLSEREALAGKLADLEDRVLDAERGRAAALAELAAAERNVAADRETIELQLRDLERLNRDIAALREVRSRLESEIAAATGALASERDRSKELAAKLADEEEKTVLAQQELAEREIRLAELLSRAETAEESFSEERALSTEAQRQVALLNRQLAALRAQIAALNETLEVTEAKNAEQEVQIVNLGQRLNAALATKVQELTRYRSEFFGRLREVLGNRSDIRIVGDRFVFQSEVLFDSAQATLNPEGELQLAAFAETLQRIAAQIPADIDWVLRVDGHTDVRPISSAQFPSNWELSAARAIEVVTFLIDRGIPPERLVAAGFGEFQPLDTARSEAAYRRNRRIEFKLTER
ncbi:MAG: peptidoglycan -binding protein [Alphaproteobacteria bacterium]